MGRLRRGLLPGAVILAFVIGGCGPTANVNSTDTPSPIETEQPTASQSPSTGLQPTGSPAQGSPNPTGSESPLPTGSATDIPLATERPSATATPPTGTLWRQVEGFPSGSAVEVRSVVATASGFVAVGYEPMPGEGAFGRHQGLVWRSADGLAWYDTAETTFQFVTPEKIVALGDALYVLGKQSNCDIIDDQCVEPPEAGWALWRSTNGTPWERLPQLPSMQAGIVDDLLAGHDRLAAFGSVGEDDSIGSAWFSTDGANWTETSDLGDLDWITAMAAAPTGFSAFGTQFMPDLEEDEVRAALTTDYTHFAAAPAPAYGGGITIGDITLGSNGMVAVGYGAPDGGVATSVALYSVDGAAWTEVTDVDGSLTRGSMSIVHGLDTGGYVALGDAPETDEFGRLLGQSWFSGDGQAWHSIGTFGTPFDQLETSAIGAPGLVAFTVVQDELNEENVTSTISVWFVPVDQLAAL